MPSEIKLVNVKITIDVQEYLISMRDLKEKSFPVWANNSQGDRRNVDMNKRNAGLFRSSAAALANVEHYSEDQAEPGFCTDDMPSLPGYVISNPAQITAPFVFNSPHSGQHYSPHFLGQSRLSPLLLRKSEDALVDQIFKFVPELGAPLMAATFPRAYVDVNREPFELDPKLFTVPLPAHANANSTRVSAGLGTIARVVGAGLEIYREPLSMEEALWRISNYYLPYHQQLQQLLDDQLERFDTAILIDCHSMPSNNRALKTGATPDIIIGDRFGSSAHEKLVDYLVELLEKSGVTVGRNAPYAGGYITEHYGDPDKGIHAIQVEISRALYMDEVALIPHSGFPELSALLNDVFEVFVRDVTATLSPLSEAAE